MKINRKLILALLVVIITLVCMNVGSTELRDRAIVQALGLDYEDNRYILTAQFYNPTSSNAVEKSQTKVVKGEGETIYQAIEDINLKNSRELYLSHNSFIALGIDCTVNIAQVLNYFHSDTQTRPDVLLVITNKAEDMINFTSDENTTPAQSVEKILKNATQKGILTDMRLYKIMRLRQSLSSDYAIPFVTVNSEEIVTNGTVVFKNDNLAFFLDQDKTMGLNFINSKIKNALVTVDDTGFEIISSNPSTKIKINGDTAEFFIDIKISAKQKSTDNITKELKQNLEHEIYSKSQNALTTVLLEGNCDILNFGSLLRKKGINLLKYQGDWCENIEKKVTISVNCQFQ